MKILKAELRDMFSPDVTDLRDPGLPDDRAFCVPLQIDFGAEGEPGADQFDILVCNPDIEEIERLLRELADQCIGYTWPEVAKKLSKFAHWECEDMRESGWSVN